MKYLKKCPHCGSKSGFSVRIFSGKYFDITHDFKGEEKDIEQYGKRDKEVSERCVVCIDCNKVIPIDKVKFHL